MSNQSKLSELRERMAVIEGTSDEPTVDESLLPTEHGAEPADALEQFIITGIIPTPPDNVNRAATADRWARVPAPGIHFSRRTDFIFTRQRRGRDSDV